MHREGVSKAVGSRLRVLPAGWRRGSGVAAAGGASAVRGCGGGWLRRELACGPEDLQPGAHHCKLHLIGWLGFASPSVWEVCWTVKVISESSCVSFLALLLLKTEIWRCLWFLIVESVCGTVPDAFEVTALVPCKQFIHRFSSLQL